MKLKHWLIGGLVIVGVLFTLHVYFSHGGVSGFREGIGLQ
jgi:hypothetical protein